MKAGKNNPSQNQANRAWPVQRLCWAGQGWKCCWQGPGAEQGEPSTAHKANHRFRAAFLSEEPVWPTSRPKLLLNLPSRTTERMERARACFFLSLSPFPPLQTPCPAHKARAGLGTAITLITLVSLQGVDRLGPGSLGAEAETAMLQKQGRRGLLYHLKKTLQLLASQKCLVHSCRIMPGCAGLENCRP